MAKRNWAKVKTDRTLHTARVDSLILLVEKMPGRERKMADLFSEKGWEES
jgi:hypothetical protein